MCYLILVKLAVLVFLLSLVLEGDDDKTDEDVDHEECDDDDVDEEEDGDGWTMVVDRTYRLCVRIYRLVQQPANRFISFINAPRKYARNSLTCFVLTPGSETFAVKRLLTLASLQR